MTPEEGFADIQELIENSVMVTVACRQVIRLVHEVSDKHIAMGFQGMAHRSKVLSEADPQRWAAMRIEYTDRAMESAVAMGDLMKLLIGIQQGASETIQAKMEMEN